MAFQEVNLYGNIIDIRDAGANKVIVFAEANFRKNGKSTVFDIMTFARHEEAVAELVRALDETRINSANDKAALRNVHLTARIAKDAKNELQLQFISTGKQEPKSEKAVAPEAEVVAEPVVAEAVVAENDDVPF